MSGDPRESDHDPLIGSIRALKAEVNRWIDAELRARADARPASTTTAATPTPADLPAVATQSDDPRGRLDALAARLEGRLRQGGRSAPAEAPAGG